MIFFLLFLMGLGVGVFGTLIGAGGGFILVPLLLLLYPQENPETITSISLAVTFANALSGSIAYGRMKRIHYRYGLIFAAATVPGAVLGAISTYYISRKFFDLVLALVLLSGSIYIYIKTLHKPEIYQESLTDLSGKKLLLGILISLGLGFVSSFLGIGGGIIHVPVLANVLDFPVHMATATSHFILAIMTLVGTLVHILTGAFHHGIRRALALGLGVLIGAQIGATLSRRVKGPWIIRILALSLFFVGMRLLMINII